MSALRDVTKSQMEVNQIKSARNTFDVNNNTHGCRHRIIMHFITNTFDVSNSNSNNTIDVSTTQPSVTRPEDKAVYAAAFRLC